MRLPAALAVSLLLAAVAGSARADELAPPPTTTKYFGGQILAVDAAVVGLGLVGSGVPLLAFPLAAPTVHIAHGDGSGAVGSFLLHTGLPIVGGYLGYELDTRHCDGEDLCGLGGLILGGGLGMLTATLMDAAFLAHVERPVFARAPRGLPTPTLAFSPRGGFMLGLAGRL
jgi:hypothetical protein